VSRLVEGLEEQLLGAKEAQWSSLSPSSVRPGIGADQVHQAEEVAVGEEVEVAEHQKACAGFVQVPEGVELCEELFECLPTGMEEVVLLPALLRVEGASR